MSLGFLLWRSCNQYFMDTRGYCFLLKFLVAFTSEALWTWTFHCGRTYNCKICLQIQGYCSFLFVLYSLDNLYLQWMCLFHLNKFICIKLLTIFSYYFLCKSVAMLHPNVENLYHFTSPSNSFSPSFVLSLLFHLPLFSNSLAGN